MRELSVQQTFSDHPHAHWPDMSQTFVKSFTHLRDRPQADRALPLLQRVASLVKPIMRKHGWVLPVLAEFFPESPNLVGLNINGGQEILLRLRPAYAPDSFYDIEFIVHTMLHELTHNICGPHDEKFYKFLAVLEQEYDALQRSGYAGEGFFSEGHRLGANVSHNLPPHIARQKALEAAEKRRHANLIMSGGGRLGGTRIKSNKSPRELAAEAAERRARDEKACASGAVAQREAEKAAKESVKNEVIDLTHDSDSETDAILVDQTSPISRTSATIVRHVTGKGVKRPRIGSIFHNVLQAGPSRGAPIAACAPARDRLEISPMGQWSCSQCTLLNDPINLQCVACEAVRPYVGEQSEAEGWTCTVCLEPAIPLEFWYCSFCGTIKAQS
ncbi:hypothetical protein AcV7_001234 [Taiwanofungus camphoratus]|nr:hypothetical protein AcV7_001234 [Antrodia cinnamomea]